MQERRVLERKISELEEEVKVCIDLLAYWYTLHFLVMPLTKRVFTTACHSLHFFV